MIKRKPLVLANWKMSMTLIEGLQFARTLRRHVGDYPAQVDVVVCPSFTLLWPLAAALKSSGVFLGAQNAHPGPGASFTGEVSPAMLWDAGCSWVLVGHFERRVHVGETEQQMATKVRAVLDAGLRPVLLIGESEHEQSMVTQSLERQLGVCLAQVRGAEIGSMCFIYEPQVSIGVAAASPPDHARDGAAKIRRWLTDRFGDSPADGARIIYGGSVTPENARAFFDAPGLDGLATTRRGRDAKQLMSIVRTVAQHHKGA